MEINWSNVVFIESERRLILSELELYEIPDPIINLYHNRVCQLDMSFNKLTSIAGLSLFASMEELILDNNQLGDITFPAISNLKLLSLNNNMIRNLDNLLDNIKESFPQLDYLSLLGNPCCPFPIYSGSIDEKKYHKYREKVLNHLPTLQFLDSTPVSIAERMRLLEKLPPIYPAESDRSVEKFTQISGMVRKTFSSIHQGRFGKNRPTTYNPLPPTVRIGQHRGAYVKCKFKYVGAHSEGNRFILNKDL
ncbi:leucine-rich melanocyte differentiation-associated protein-like [Phlebotomus argentipes]|uniref:leucine-rich melanocyte differentiation-associated protein-like n=1 Tax=Phlebotomus argentipes TaxID=94469 RepID=UPI0028932D28|nr:leucine-rich melanocyte differentiation-associated protein-like [Phlebotomus argentipes]